MICLLYKASVLLATDLQKTSGEASLEIRLPACLLTCFLRRFVATVLWIACRHPYLWQLLTEERWGAASMQPCPGEGLVALQDRFTTWAGAEC